MVRFFIAALMLLWFGQTQTAAVTVSTDQIEYQPDTTATIDGSGFLPGEMVELQIFNLTTPSATGPEYDPWTTNADVNGYFETTWYCTTNELDQTLQLTATGLTSGLVAQRVFADAATATPANASISADTAASAASPAWTTLGKIVVSENNKADFSAGTGVTLILKAPAGWQFNTAATPTTTFSGPEITAASTAISDASTLTVTVTVTGNEKYQDIFTISGVQIRPTIGNPLATGLWIYRPTTGGGTLIINGVITSTNGSSGANFGALTETNGAFAGYSISGASSTTAGASQNLTIQKIDQAGNVVNDRTTKTLTFSGLSSVGSNNPKINGATTAFSSGISVAFNSSGLATTTLSLIPYKVETATLNVTDGTKTSAAVSGGLALTVSAMAASKLAFTTSTVTVTVGVASGSITVQRQDQFGNPTTAGATSVTLSSSSTGTKTFNPASLTIASGSSSATFTYTDTHVGSPTITAVSSGLTSGTQQETINQLSTSVAVSSSESPSGYKDSVSFTAALPAAAMGEVIFMVNRVVLSTNVISSGAATSAVATSLPCGTNTITAEYAGDGNYTGSTNNLSGGQVVTNHPPVANAAPYGRAKGTSIKISITNLLAQSTSDADGDSLGLVAVAGGLITNNTVIANTTNGSGIYIANPYAGSAYIILSATNNSNETFAYVVNDPSYPALTATNVMTVTVTNAVGQLTGSIATSGGGAVTTTWAGIPGSTYVVQSSADLSTWTDLWTTNAPAAGVFNFTDLTPPQPAAYYRLRQN
jgi:hypothetical protein